MVARDILPDEVAKKETFLLLHLGGYLLTVAHGNTYLPRGTKDKNACHSNPNIQISADEISQILHKIGRK